MAKKNVKIRKGDKWLHTPSQGTYEVIGITEIKLPHIGWFKGVIYKSESGKQYTRFIEDFDNKFIKLNP